MGQIEEYGQLPEDLRQRFEQTKEAAVKRSQLLRETGTVIQGNQALLKEQLATFAGALAEYNSLATPETHVTPQLFLDLIANNGADISDIVRKQIDARYPDTSGSLENRIPVQNE